MSQKQVVIAFGGVSPEHEVSVLTALQVASILEDKPVDLIPLYITKQGRWYTGGELLDLKRYEEIDQLIGDAAACSLAHDDYGRPVLKEHKNGLFSRPATYPVDLMFLAFHGSQGENGSFQGLCETYHIPYTGCDVKSSAIGMDKIMAKRICRSADIPVLDEVVLHESVWGSDQTRLLDRIEHLGYPVVVKPAELGSSIGVSMVNDRNGLTDAVELAFRYDERLLVEPAVHPLMEINCSVLGEKELCRTSVCERPLGKDELLSFQDKYQAGSSDGSKGMAAADREIPADIPDELRDRIQNVSKKIFALFGASGVARLDFLVKADSDRFYFNEINTIPGSFSFYLWEASDLPFDRLLDELMELALKRHSRRQGRIQSYETNLLSEKAARGIKGLKGAKTTRDDRS